MDSSEHRQRINRKNIGSKNSEEPRIEGEKPKSIRSIHRAIDLLSTISMLQGKMSNLTRLAREVQLPNSTVHRILTVLVQRGFVSYEPVGKNYHLGIELFRLGKEAQHFNIRDHLRNVLERISHESEDTVYLNVPSGNDGLCIDIIEGKYPIHTMGIRIGGRRPLGTSAGPLALLSFLPDDRVEAVIVANKRRYHHYGNLSEEKVRHNVLRSRKLGYALSEDIVIKGTTGIGVPVNDHEGRVVAAISVGAVSERLNGDRREYIVKLIKSEIAAVNIDS
jgi:DNA-binding IclR family transcriptional regulator